MKISQGTLIGVQIKELSFRTQIFSRTSAAVMPVKNKCQVTKFTHVKNCLSFLVTAKCGSPVRRREQIIDDNFNKSASKKTIHLSVWTVLKEFNWDYRSKIMLLSTIVI